MPDTVTIRLFEERDLEPTLATLRLALGETALLRRTPEWFAWKHFDNPFGRSLLVVAEADDQIVGLRAFMRWQMVTPGGDMLRCVRAVDTATHPDYLRRGIFRRLTLEALDQAAAEGVDLVFNTPNPKSGAGYLSMGWVEVGPIGVMVWPTWRLARRTGSGDFLPDSEAIVPESVPALGIEVDDRPAQGLRTPVLPSIWPGGSAATPPPATGGSMRPEASRWCGPTCGTGAPNWWSPTCSGRPGQGSGEGAPPVPGRLPGRLVLGWLSGAAGGHPCRPDPRALCQVSHAGGPAFARPSFRPRIEVDDRPALGLRTPRTPGYLAWRFGGHPTARYRRVDAAGSSRWCDPICAIAASNWWSPMCSVHRRAGLCKRAPPIPGRLPGGLVLGWLSGAAGGDPCRSDPRARCQVSHAGGPALRDLPVDVTRLDGWDLAMSDLELL